MPWVLVNVSQNHIRKGRRGDVCACPIALATRRLFNRVKLLVSTEDIYCYHDADETYVVRLPKIVSKFVIAFDCHVPCKPLSFKIFVPKQLTEYLKA